MCAHVPVPRRSSRLRARRGIHIDEPQPVPVCTRCRVVTGAHGERNVYQAKRLVRVETHDHVLSYCGKRGCEKLAHVTCSDGTVLRYEGERGTERLVCVERTDDSKEYYEGSKDTESLMRIESVDGSMEHYEGSNGTESLVRVNSVDGSVTFLKGERGHELVVCIRHADGHVERFDAPAFTA
jgi:hypothetical protein